MAAHRLCYNVPGGLAPAPGGPATVTAAPARPRVAAPRALGGAVALGAAGGLQAPCAGAHASLSARVRPSPAAAPLARGGDGAPAGGAGAGGTAVVWFRADLRVHDHPALFHAVEEHARVVAVFVFDPRRFCTTHFRFKRTGPRRARFLRESVAGLRTALRARGSELLVRVGHPEQVLPALCARAGAGTLLFHAEVSGEDRAVERAVMSAAREAGVETSALWSSTLYEAGDMPFALADVPQEFIAFREQVQQGAGPREPLPAPDKVPPPPRAAGAPGDIPSMRELGLEEPVVAWEDEQGGRGRLVGGEAEAIGRLERYARECARLAKGRSAACRLGREVDSMLPWLSVGCLSPRRLYAEVKRKAERATVTTTYFELVWRDFFRLMIVSAEIAADEARRRRKPLEGLARA